MGRYVASNDEKTQRSSSSLIFSAAFSNNILQCSAPSSNLVVECLDHIVFAPAESFTLILNLYDKVSSCHIIFRFDHFFEPNLAPIMVKTAFMY